MTEAVRAPEARPWLPSRVTGVDAARGLALIGMFVAHVAPAAASVDAAELIAIADERPRLLFALTAGIGLGLLTGGTRPAEAARGLLRRQVAIRAVLLIVLGVLVVALLHPLVFVILDVYGVAFLCMVPLLFIPARTAIALGAGLLAITPALAAAAERDPATVAASDRVGGFVVDWFLTGAYPVIIWVPVMLIGLGIARLDVASTVVVRGVALAGALAASACLPLSRLVPATDPVVVGDPTAAWAVPLRASLEVVGNVGVCLLIVAATVALTDLARRPVRRASTALLAPVTAMGAMPLSVYTAHLLVISTAKRVEDGVVTDDSWPLVIGLIVGSMAGAWLWQRYVGRGPLESLFRWASGRARTDAFASASPSGRDDAAESTGPTKE